MEEKTIKERVVNYAKNKYYFHINDLNKYFVEREIVFKEDSLKKTVYRLKKAKIIYGAGKGWYSTIKEEFKLDTKPIKKIVTLVKKKFPLLEFSCWSTEQIKGYFHHLPSQFVAFVHADKDFLQSLKDFLSDSRYNVYLNPRKREAEKYVELNKKTIILRPAVSYRKPKNNNWAKIEKILVDLFMETKKINLMDMEEYKKIMSNIVLDYRINMAELLDHADRRGIKKRMQKIIIDLL
ncbi:hypothetical protein ES705_48648 [subsurface metagenome]